MGPLPLLLLLQVAASAPAGVERLCPTEVVDADHPKGWRLRLPGVPIPLRPGLSPGLRLDPPAIGLPWHGTLPLASRSLGLLLFSHAPPSPGQPRLPDSLGLDLNGDGRLEPAETHACRWTFFAGAAVAGTPPLPLGVHLFRLEAESRGREPEARLMPLTWRLGGYAAPDGWRTLLYVDQDLDGRVGPADLWLLVDAGDPRRRDLMLDATRLRHGDAPFPLPGGRESRLVAIDDGAQARLYEAPAGGAEAAYLARRAAGARERWAAAFAVDDAERRKRLRAEGGGPPREVAWLHTTEPALWRGEPGRPLLVWLDEEESTECRRFEHYALGDGRVAPLLAARFRPVHVPLGLCARDPRRRYGLASVPSLAAVSGDGTVLWRREGYVPPAELAALLGGQDGEK